MATGYVFGSVEIRPDERRLIVSGTPVALGARAFDLLLLLFENRERVVGKDELIASVWKGSVVEDGNLTVQISALRKVLGSEAISTVAGRGYRFTMPAGDVPSEAESTAAVGPAPKSLGDRPSVAVLPFVNLGGVAQDDCLADGVAEDIIIELSRFRDLLVIARNSSFSYKGRQVDVRTVGTELGVRYVLEGSLRRGSDRLRVSAQLADAASGISVWGERYDRALDDLFEVQTDITRAIVAEIAPRIEAAELSRVRAGPKRSLSAYASAIRARASAARAYRDADPSACEEAIALANDALGIEGENVIALNALALSEFVRVYYRWASNVADAAATGRAAADRALAADPWSSQAHAWRGMLLWYGTEPIPYDAALADLRRAESLNPNDVTALVCLAMGEAQGGDPARALEHLDRAARINPRDTPMLYNSEIVRCIALFVARRYEECLNCARNARGIAPSMPQPPLYVALAAVGLGDLSTAREAVDHANRLAPGYLQVRLDGTFSPPLRKRDDQLRWQVFLRIAAGLEDPSAADALT